MGKRGGFFPFFLFFSLSIIILLQILSMVQSEKLYECINLIIEEGSIEGTEQGYEGDIDESEQNNEGDWLVWGFRVEPTTLNPYSSNNDVYSRWITVPYIFEPLLFYDFNDFTMEPHLAKSYKVSNDGLEITFRLREGICFSDGVPVTTDDVIFTYETAINPQICYSDITNLYGDVEEVIKVDKRIVKFVMKRPDFKALEKVSFWEFGILPKHIYNFKDEEEFNRRVSEPLGSGPFLFERWDVGESIFLRRNENYWGQKPRLKRIVYRFITNSVAAVQALRSGYVDIFIPEVDQFADLVEDERFRREFYCLSYWSPGVPFYFIGWNQDTEFFCDRRVRLAMTHVINREQIVSELLKGHGRVISGPFFVQGSYNDPNIRHWPYDLDTARALLDEAGWVDNDGDGVRDKNGRAFRFHFLYASDNVLYSRLARFLKDMAARAGIDVIAEPMEWSVAYGRIMNRDFEAMVMGWSGDVLEDYYQIFHSSQIVNGGSNYVSFSNERADYLLEEIRRTIDKEKRENLCKRLHKLIHEEQPYTFLFSRPSLRLLDKRFKNVNICKLGLKYWKWYVPVEEQRYN